VSGGLSGFPPENEHGFCFKRVWPFGIGSGRPRRPEGSPSEAERRIRGEEDRGRLWISPEEIGRRIDKKGGIEMSEMGPLVSFFWAWVGFSLLILAGMTAFLIWTLHRANSQENAGRGTSRCPAETRTAERGMGRTAAKRSRPFRWAGTS
jgi:hypothetical protein